MKTRGNDGAARAGRRSALVDAWAKTLRRRGDARAVVEAATGATCTFRELEARAEVWRAAHVTDARMVRGRVVVFALTNGVTWLEVFLGLMKAGAVVVPLDPGEPISAQRQIAEALGSAFWWDGARLAPVASPGRRFRDPEICLIKMTSGSTGQPRPLVFTAAQLLADARQVTATMGIGVRDLNYALIPFGHSYGLGNVTIPLLALGVPVVCGAAALPQAIADDLSRWKPTVFPTVPAVWRALAAANLAPETFLMLRKAISAGGPLSADVAREFAARYGRSLQNFYGSSETGGIAFDRTGAATLAGGVGRALRGVRVAALRGGRLRVSSAAVFTQGNRSRAKSHGCWVPPDRVSIDARGNITLLGRRGATVKIGGRRVNLAEVAARLRRVPGVVDAWVGVSEGAEPLLGAAVATTRPVGEIRAQLLSDFAAWKVPRRWAVCGEFPLTARGKVDTRALRARVFG